MGLVEIVRLNKLKNCKFSAIKEIKKREYYEELSTYITDTLINDVTIKAIKWYNKFKWKIEKLFDIDDMYSNESKSSFDTNGSDILQTTR
ncbi:hypothetical protein V1477_007703 [Vespula maculifrons]|uniref:Uncharacterized protein n=1 Tax=Vespula maculifrons TaxID=7453 RepID=A0ABD2CFH3_VESMC